MKMKKRNIIRFFCMLAWLLVVWQIYQRFQGAAWQAMMFQWSGGLLFLYLSTVTVYLKEQIMRKSYRGYWEKFLFRSIMALVSIFMMYWSITSLKNSVYDIFVDGYQIKDVIIEDKWTEYQSLNQVTLVGEQGSFKEFPSHVSFNKGKAYTVQIFPNSRFIIGINAK